MNPNDVWTNGKGTTKTGYSMSPNNIMTRLQKFEFHRSQIRLCARNRCKRRSHKIESRTREMNERGKKREKWQKTKKMKMKLDLSYLSYFVIVLIFCDQFFSAVVVRFLSLYRKSKSGLLVDAVFHLFLIRKAFLFSYAPTHCALVFLKGKSPFPSVCTPLCHARA